MPIKTRALTFLAAACLACAPHCARAESFSSWEAKAAKAQKIRDATAAIEAYNNALRLWRQSDGNKAKAKALAARAALYVDAGSIDAALRDYSRAIKLEAKTASYFLRRGRIYFDLARTSDAISDFYKATQLDPGYREAYLYRGLSYERQGDVKFAREDFKTACGLGLKQACGEASRAKAQAAQGQAAAGSDGFEAAEGSEAVKPKKIKTYKLDWQACLDGLTACTDAGGTFGDCVKQAPLCERRDRPGCCPATCVQDFQRMTSETTIGAMDPLTRERPVEVTHSEAATYREVFSPDSTCMKYAARKPR